MLLFDDVLWYLLFEGILKVSFHFSDVFLDVSDIFI